MNMRALLAVAPTTIAPNNRERFLHLGRRLGTRYLLGRDPGRGLRQ